MAVTDYCTLAEVYPLMSLVGELRDAPVAPDTTPATQLTATAAGILITQVSAEIDGHLREKGYVLPVADAEALAILKAYCQSGSAARILRSLFPIAEGVSGEAGSASAHEKAYADGLALIDRGGLAADTETDEETGFSSGFSVAVDPDVETDEEPASTSGFTHDVLSRHRGLY